MYGSKEKIMDLCFIELFLIFNTADHPYDNCFIESFRKCAYLYY